MLTTKRKREIESDKSEISKEGEKYRDRESEKASEKVIIVK